MTNWLDEQTAQYPARCLFMVLVAMGSTWLMLWLLDAHYSGGFAIAVVASMALVAVRHREDLAAANVVVSAAAAASLVLTLIFGTRDLWFSTVFCAATYVVLRVAVFLRRRDGAVTGAWVTLPTGEDAPVVLVRAQHYLHGERSPLPYYVMFARDQPITVTHGYKVDLTSVELPQEHQLAQMFSVAPDGRLQIPTRPPYRHTLHTPDGEGLLVVS